ncbi:MAG: hypothetical protein ACREQ4_00960 [Candidatus Binataceae bacterium]
MPALVEWDDRIPEFCVLTASVDEALDAAAMREIDPPQWPELRMRMHPATAILDFQWDVSGVGVFSWHGVEAAGASRRNAVWCGGQSTT